MESELKFVRERRHGIAVVGSTLRAAAARIGVALGGECDHPAGTALCAVRVLSGSELLSEMSGVEAEQLGAGRRKNGERLACLATINSPGEISVMTEEKKNDTQTAEERRAEEYKKEFAKLPLEKKIERLIELESIAFGDTFSYVLNAPYTIGGKIVDFLAQYGFKIEADERAAKKGEKPEESKEPDGAEANAKAQPKKPRSKPKKEKPTETE